MRGLLFGLILLAAAAPKAEKQHMQYQRAVTVPAPQSYFLPDEAMWEHAKAGFADLRLYNNNEEVPWALWQDHGGATGGSTGRVLDLGTTGGKTTFLIQTNSDEYDRVEFEIDAKDFLAKARIEGVERPGGPRTDLGNYTLFDFSKEKLGRNVGVQIPASRFPYLAVTIDGVASSAIKGASVPTGVVKDASYANIRTRLTQEEQGRRTVLSLELPPRVPVERIVFDVDPAQVNFVRDFRVESLEAATGSRAKETWYGVLSGQLQRVDLERRGERIRKENLEYDFSTNNAGTKYRITIENGDNPPLRVRNVRALLRERRIYMQATQGTQLVAMYGDEKVDAPAYDYTRLFNRPENAQIASLGPEEKNASYVARADERPWSERNPQVMWAALVIAVVGLAAVAIRSFK